MDKKGVFGLDTAKVVIVFALVAALVIIAGVAVLSQMRASYESAETLKTSARNNETITDVDDSGDDLYPLQAATFKRNAVCTILFVTNATGGKVYTTQNYTTLNNGCTLIAKDANNNNTNWNVSYTYTYNSADAYNLVANYSDGQVKFFKELPTMLTLLAVVVLIMIIAIVIVVVSRFQTGGENMRENL